MTALGVVTAANSADAEAASDGDATVLTGAAVAVGNTSATELDQDAVGHVPGLVVDTQIGAIANGGLAVANTGENFATGNDSGDGCSGGGDNDGIGPAPPASRRTRWLLSGNRTTTSSRRRTSSGRCSWPARPPRPTADRRSTRPTGRPRSAPAMPRRRATSRGRTSPRRQTATSPASAECSPPRGLSSRTSGSRPPTPARTPPTATSPRTTPIWISWRRSARGTRARSTSTSSVLRRRPTPPRSAARPTAPPRWAPGAREATGNASNTDLSQRQTGHVGGLGLTLGTQVGAVANAGVGIANTGRNNATGNESDNAHGSTEDGPTEPGQTALINSSSGADPAETTLLGPATASNTASVTNTSDGEACICTGNAVASGNVSTTTLAQDLDLSTTSGFIVLTEVGGVLNAGLGLANTGVNTAVGNSSTNDTFADQISQANDALLEPVDGPQTASNSLTLANNSDGSGHVGSGNASGTGNQSTTSFAQAAAVDSGFAVSSLVGGTTNVGAGIANSGLNDAMGNDSVNTVILDQEADGSGLVANQGEGINESDGTAIIGDPQCCGDEDVPDEETPGLPRTGGPLEGEAVIGLLLLLAGSALRRRSRLLSEV